MTTHTDPWIMAYWRYDQIQQVTGLSRSSVKRELKAQGVRPWKRGLYSAREVCAAFGIADDYQHRTGKG